jgi:Aspartyl protease
MKLNYRTYDLQEKSELLGKHIKRPVIKIHLISGGESVPCAAIIDSGADVSIFPADLGEQLGIDVRSGEHGFSAGMNDVNFSETFLHRVTLKIGELRYPTIVGFSYAPTRRNYGILGQKGFFDLFAIRFDLSKGEIELETE